MSVNATDLERENARLKKALNDIAEAASSYSSTYRSDVTLRQVDKIATAALEYKVPPLPIDEN